MVLDISCAACGEKLDEPGAILLSPPLRLRGGDSDDEMVVRKRHICDHCNNIFETFISVMRKKLKLDA